MVTERERVGEREKERERYKHRQEWGRERKIVAQTGVGEREGGRQGGRERKIETQTGVGEREEYRVGERKIETQAGVGEKDSSTDMSAGETELIERERENHRKREAWWERGR